MSYPLRVIYPPTYPYLLYEFGYLKRDFLEFSAEYLRAYGDHEFAEKLILGLSLGMQFSPWDLYVYACIHVSVRDMRFK